MFVCLDALDAAHLIDRLERLARSGAVVKGLNPAQWEALRYLGRANRFSRTPAALADYLGSTRGTVSQTLIALEQKGFAARQPSRRDRRSVELGLTEAGAAALAEDPMLALAGDIGAAGDAARLAEALRGVLRAAMARNGGRAFGVCHGCRHFRRGGDPGRGPHRCALLHEPLSDEDSQAICMEQEDA